MSFLKETIEVAEKLYNLFKSNKKKAFFFIVAIVIAITLVPYVKNYFAEKGRQAAIFKVKPDLVNVEKKGLPEKESQGDFQNIQIFPSTLRLEKNAQSSEQEFFVINKSKTPHFSVEIKGIIEGMDERCEEIKIKKGWTIDKAHKPKPGEIPKGLQFWQTQGRDDDGKKAIYFVISLVEPGKSKRFIARLTSNLKCGAQEKKDLFVPLRVVRYDKLPPPVVSLLGDKMRAIIGYPFGIPPEVDKALDRANRRLKEQAVAELAKKAATEVRPLLIVVPIKDDNTKTYLVIKRNVDGGRQYRVHIALDIHNVGSVSAKDVTLQRFESLIKFPLNRRQSSLQKKRMVTEFKPISPSPVKPTIGPGGWETIRDSTNIGIPPPVLLNFFEKHGIPFKWEVSYRGELNPHRRYKTTVEYQIGKHSYSVFESLYE